MNAVQISLESERLIVELHLNDLIALEHAFSSKHFSNDFVTYTFFTLLVCPLLVAFNCQNSRQAINVSEAALSVDPIYLSVIFRNDRQESVFVGNWRLWTNTVTHFILTHDSNRCNFSIQMVLCQVESLKVVDMLDVAICIQKY